MSARQIFLEGDAVAFFETPALLRDTADSMNAADILVAHDARRPVRVVRMPVGPTDSGGLDLQQPCVIGNFWPRVLAQLSFAQAKGGRGQYRFHQANTRDLITTGTAPERSSIAPISM